MSHWVLRGRSYLFSRLPKWLPRWVLIVTLVATGTVIGFLRIPRGLPASQAPSVSKSIGSNATTAQNSAGPAQNGSGNSNPSNQDTSNKVRLVTYTVQDGDTLSSIAERFNTSVPSIVAINNLASPDRLSVGMQLTIMENASGLVKRVSEGDTLWDIAQKYGISVDEIIKANDLADANSLSPGQLLLLPGAKPGSGQFGNFQLASRGSTFIWPVSGPVTSGFGWRVHPITGEEQFHQGIDIAADMGTPVRAAMGGIVTHVGWLGGYGRLVVIRHSGGFETYYGHLSAYEAYEGQEVSAGEVIGYVGDSGHATGPNCHFEIRINGRPVNPREYLP